MTTWTCIRCGHPYLNGYGCECLPGYERVFHVNRLDADYIRDRANTDHAHGPESWLSVVPGVYVSDGQQMANPGEHSSTYFGDDWKKADRFRKFLNSRRVFDCVIPRQFLKP